MKLAHATGILMIALSSAALAQVPDAGSGTVVGEICGDGSSHPAGFNCAAYLCSTGWAQSHGAGYACGSSAAGTSGTDLRGAIVNAGTEMFSDFFYKLFSGDPDAKAAADAAAAEAEREQQAALARQQALEEQKRQAMFERLSNELKMSAFGDMQLKGFDNSADQMQLKGFGDAASNTSGGEMQLKGFGDAPTHNTTSSSSTPLGPQTCFFGECGPQDPGLEEPIDPWNDPNVVDLRDVQQGSDLAVVATKAPPADRQAIMDQALAAANGDQSIQLTNPANDAVPVVSEQGLIAFQQANNAFRQAHDSAYQLQQSYQLNQQRESAANAVVTATEQQLEADLRANIDGMTLEQKEEAMARIFDAALQQELAYDKTWAEYLAAREKYYREKYETEMYLWNTALGKQGNPPAPSPQLRQLPAPKQDLVLRQQVQLAGAKQAGALPGPPDSDLSLVLPSVQPVIVPRSEDTQFLRQIEAASGPQSVDSVTRKVIDELKEDIRTSWSTQPTLVCPPNILNQYANNTQLQQEMNAESNAIYTAQQTADHAAMQDAENEWNQKIAQLQSQGVFQPGIPLEQQAQSNLALGAQLTVIQRQVTADLDYKVTRAQFEAEKTWQQWIEQEEAKLPVPTLTAAAAVRD